MTTTNYLRKIGSMVVVMLLHTLCINADSIEWFNGKEAVSVSVQKMVDPVVGVAFGMFAGDMEAVTGMKAIMMEGDRATIKVYQLDKATKAERRQMATLGVEIDSIGSLMDGFSIKAVEGSIVVVGTNGRGAAYGLLELSRMAGVSPWIWWGDVAPERQEKLYIDDDFSITKGASVEYRGLFINDEDWSFRAWSQSTYEKSKEASIGARSYRRIFELLLRLRANTIWPGMHKGTTAFFSVPGAKEAADSCGITVGTSHCEPLLRNNVYEWNEKKRGKFNYITNKSSVHEYWIERLKQVKGSAGGNMFTIGMRGIHDDNMEGVDTPEEQLQALQQVIDDQQELLRQYIGEPEEQLQVFVPYKEVLEIYEMGLNVPDYATLMWCDDNYGYMTRLSNQQEQERTGGAGAYYHLSYLGRPHDYIWLTTTQPGLLYNEMREAYDHNVRKIWIVNVHEPKVAGYDLELFLDMAWDINSVSASSVAKHYKAWLCRQFGKEAGEKIFPAMYEWYRLCGERRPEFMGWSQVELDKHTYDKGFSQVKDSPFSEKAFGNELERYLECFRDVRQTVEEAENLLRPEIRDAYFAAIIYPVAASEAHARKMLEAQKARAVANGRNTFVNEDLDLATARSQQAYIDVRALTKRYNYDIANGKWCRSMNMRPRDLPVYAAPLTPNLLTDYEVDQLIKENPISTGIQHPVQTDGAVAMNACDFESATEGTEVVEMLGHSMKAVRLPKGGELSYSFSTDKRGKAVLKTALIPTQPNDGGDLRFSVSIDGSKPMEFSLKEPFRSETWKQNVLRGQAVKTLKIDNLEAGEHTLTIKALDNHIVVDQWMVDYNTNRTHYLFPIKQD